MWKFVSPDARPVVCYGDLNVIRFLDGGNDDFRIGPAMNAGISNNIT